MAASIASPISIRSAVEGDVPAITQIYTPYVTHSHVTWAIDPPSLEDMLAAFHDRKRQGFPYIVAISEDKHSTASADRPDSCATAEVLGFAYASTFRSRVGYRFTVENSIYVAPHAQRRGVGTALLRALMDACAAAGFRQMIASISVDDAHPERREGHGSIALHASCGFKEVARFPRIGFKFGRWLDAVFMQCELGDGSRTLPEETSLPPALRVHTDARKEPE